MYFSKVRDLVHERIVLSKILPSQRICKTFMQFLKTKKNNISQFDNYFETREMSNKIPVALLIAFKFALL